MQCQWLIKIASILMAQIIMTNGSYAVTRSKKPLFYRINAPIKQSVVFMRLRDKKILYQQNGENLLVPASVTKLVTSGASLYHLGPQFTFKTGFYHTGHRQGHMIKGDLVIVGSGDPLLINEKLWQAAADLRHLGIRFISGDIVIDNSLFDNETRDQSRRSGKSHSTHAYDAPLTAFGVNFNTFTIAIAPGERVGSKGIVEFDPYPLRGMRMENKLRTIRSGQKTSSRVSRISQQGKPTKMIVSGHISQTGKLKKVYRSVGNPVKSAGEQLRAFLNKEGIVIQGTVKEGLRPRNSKELLSLEGYPLKRTIESLNKFSNNYVADVLVKKLSTIAHKDQPGSLQHGLRTIKNFLSGPVGLDSTFIIKNGSGLSPENRLSASQLVRLLAYMEERFDLFPEYLNSLPSAGLDGTLEDRFHTKKTNKLKGKVRAKTGTLTSPISVASLAGYMRHHKHGLIAFAIIENGVRGKGQPGLLDLRERQDKALANFYNLY